MQCPGYSLPKAASSLPPPNLFYHCKDLLHQYIPSAVMKIHLTNLEPIGVSYLGTTSRAKGPFIAEPRTLDSPTAVITNDRGFRLAHSVMFLPKSLLYMHSYNGWLKLAVLLRASEAVSTTTSFDIRALSVTFIRLEHPACLLSQVLSTEASVCSGSHLSSRKEGGHEARLRRAEPYGFAQKNEFRHITRRDSVTLHPRCTDH
ncbi:hypothetical protein B0H63DRAFT_279203 [Podospora didyma]|uniref:Uncharacterized protein n=1 Tax=Podospora didyma TaxID=330526 RepID=A0AAE0KF97_9PEZI|nr:hypothetical protein B0H63DRAFT_279203 [Podospora didyma]